MARRVRDCARIIVCPIGDTAHSIAVGPIGLWRPRQGQFATDFLWCGRARRWINSARSRKPGISPLQRSRKRRRLASAITCRFTDLTHRSRHRSSDSPTLPQPQSTAVLRRTKAEIGKNSACRCVQNPPSNGSNQESTPSYCSPPHWADEAQSNPVSEPQPPRVRAIWARTVDAASNKT